MELSKKAMSIKPSTTMAISSRAAEMKAAGVDVVSFGEGEPDFDTPAHIAQAGIAAIQNGQTRYTPAAGTPELRQAVCDKLKRDNGLEYEPAQVVISNGAKHSLMNTFMAILHEGDEVIIPAPFWLSYAEMVRIAGGVPVIIHTKKENGFMMTKEELENKIATLTGGRAAEELVFGQITTGASNDIEQATKLARAMVTRYGMTDEFDMVAMETVTNQYLGGDTSLACSADTQKEIDKKVVETVKAQHEKARRLLAEHRSKLDELAKYLYEKETITGSEFMKILQDKEGAAK